MSKPPRPDQIDIFIYRKGELFRAKPILSRILAIVLEREGIVIDEAVDDRNHESKEVARVEARAGT